MEIEINRIDDVNHIALNGELSIYHAKKVGDKLQSIIAENLNVVVSLKEVFECDTAGIQVLIWGKKLCKQKNLKFSLVEHSEPVIRVIELLGLVGFFRDKIRLSVEHRQKYSFRYGMYRQDLD